jgi:hypothetical protein
MLEKFAWTSSTLAFPENLTASQPVVVELSQYVESSPSMAFDGAKDVLEEPDAVAMPPSRRARG